IELYKKCKVLFFPSLSEGLGIPIIEAQLCGCRVLTRNAMPMNQLLCRGSRVMKEAPAENSALLGKMLSENFDYEELAQDAHRKFSLEKVYHHLMEILH
ncbi:glycosyltransferase, partial [Mailhella massiliensis]